MKPLNPVTRALTKRQRTRVRRVLNNFRGPLNHMSRDGLDKIFAGEYKELRRLRGTIRTRAILMGYDPEEDLIDVSKESYYTE